MEQSLEERLARIETKIDCWMQAQIARDAEHEKRSQDTEDRLRTLERARWYDRGFIAAASVAAHYLLKKLI